MALVQREHIPYVVPFREDHDRSVGKSDAKVAVALDNCLSRLDICRAERLQPVGAANDLSEQRRLRCGTDVARQQVVEFGKHKRRE